MQSPTSPARKTLFISDLHLQESEPKTIEKLLSLLHHCDASVDAIYILGDLFEAWIGEESWHSPILAALHNVSQRNISIYFLPGNRDFLVSKKFLAAAGIRLLTDEHIANIYHTPVLLMHGDTLCTRDVKYLRARKILRSPLFKLYWLFPAFIRKSVAKALRQKSHQHTSTAPYQIMDVTHEEVLRVLQKHHVDHLIHGHTHRPAIHHLTVDNKPATRLVLGAWHDHGSVLIWDETGKKELHDL